MANDFNNLGPILQAIGRQIAGRRGSSSRADRPERDLPILLLPQEVPVHVSTGRSRAERNLPYLMGDVALPERSVPTVSTVPTVPTVSTVPSARPQRKEAGYPRLDPNLGPSPA